MFAVKAKSGKARAGKFYLDRYSVHTPVFMPVGTYGAMKGLTFRQMENMDFEIILSNTYHVNNYIGTEILDKYGGLHNFMGWNRALLTDSGGFQMVSLGEFINVTEEGVSFRDPLTKKNVFLRPEDSIEIQMHIGSDIMMQLDDVVHVLTEGDRPREAMERSVRWLKRCIDKKNTGDGKGMRQLLFPIVQGGLDLSLRGKCIDGMREITDKYDKDNRGIAIGGLSGGEGKDEFWKVINYCTSRLGPEKPIYAMGIGYPIDILVCSVLGVDMFDCVAPTRMGRFGNAYTSKGFMKIRSKKNRTNFNPIEPGCQCQTCRKYTVAALSCLMDTEIGSILVSVHNLFFLKNLVRNIRRAIKKDRLAEFSKGFAIEWFGGVDKIPGWVKDSFESQSIRF